MFYDGYYVEYLFLNYIKEHERFPNDDAISYNTWILSYYDGFSPMLKYHYTVDDVLNVFGRPHPCRDKADKKLCEILRAFFYFYEKSKTISGRNEITDYFVENFPKYLNYLVCEQFVVKRSDDKVELTDKAERRIITFEKMQEMRRQILGETDDDDQNKDQSL